MTSEIFQAGVARADITPPVGIRLCGYAVREGGSTGIHMPLTATALVLRGGGTTIAIVALDLTLSSVDYATRIRRACADALGIGIDCILINYNHTHSAPVLPGFVPYDTPVQLRMQEDYGDLVVARTADACRQAASRLASARLAAGWGECRANVNRRQKAPDGSMLMGEDPAGPSDKSVGVIRVDDLAGNALAVLYRFSCHTVTLGPRTNVISPDFIGPARTLIERELGCLSLFLQGCAGNQNPITGIGNTPQLSEDTARIGQMLGAEVVKTCSTLRTHRRRKAPRLIQSVAVYWMYETEDIAPGDEGTIRVATEELSLPLSPFPSIEEIEQERAGWAARLEEVKTRGSPEADLNVAVRFDYWSQLRLDAARRGPNPATVRFPLQVFRIDEIAIVGMPFEVMSETGTEIRAASPIGDTFVLGYSNGIVTYLPTPQVSREGGMEAKLGYKNYLNPSELPADWEPQIRRHVGSLLEQAMR